MGALLALVALFYEVLLGLSQRAELYVLLGFLAGVLGVSGSRDCEQGGSDRGGGQP